MKPLNICTSILSTIFKRFTWTHLQKQVEWVAGKVPHSAGALMCGLGHVPFLHRGQCLLLTCG